MKLYVSNLNPTTKEGELGIFCQKAGDEYLVIRKALDC